MEEKKIPWPDWEIVRLLGRGSFGEVYEIQRNNFGSIEHAALKVITIPQSKSDIDELYNDGYDSESITARFQSYLESIVKEYSLMTEMKGHGNIVYCDDLKYIQHDDGIGWDIYIKMELLTPLVKSLSQTITDDQVIRLGTDICNALMLCKSKNIVHRDIKPQNIFVSQDGSYKLGDFGVAKTAERTTSGTKVGTYKYMAPEVYKSEPYGAGADIYSLGLVMYWMLNERRTPFLPLPPQTPTATMEDDARLRRFKGERLPAPSHGSEELKRIVLKACAYDPKERYHSAAEMREDLLQINDRTEGTAGVFFDREEKERQRRIHEEKARREQERLARERADEQRRQEEERKRRDDERRKEEAKEAERISKQREAEEKRKKNIIIAVAACICLLIATIAVVIPKKGREVDDNISVQEKVPVDKQILVQVYQAYIPILENALDENRAVYSDGDDLCKAAMEDLDNDGIQELIVTNLYGNDLSYGEANVVFSVYDYENEKLQVRIDHQDYGDFGSAGLDSYVTVLHRKGTPMIMTYNEIGETSGHDNYMPSRHGTVVIYDCTTYLPSHVYRIDRDENQKLVFSVDNQEVSEKEITKELAQYDDLKENWNESFIMLQFPTDEVMAPVTSWLDELYINPIVEKAAIPKQGTSIRAVHIMRKPEEIEYELISDLADGDETFWGQNQYCRNEVVSIQFIDTMGNVPADAWDVSDSRNGSIKAWLDDGKLTVAANGIISLNQNASYLFAGFCNLEEIDFGNCVDTTGVTNMHMMYACCHGLRELDLSGFDTSNVMDTSSMFLDCGNLTKLNLSGFDTTNVTDMSHMFDMCINLTELNLSGFNTSNVTDMSFMFSVCLNLSELNLSGFNTSKVADMSGMMSNCQNLIQLDLSGFDTSKVTDFDNMFYSCKKLQRLDLSGFDTSSVDEPMLNMFSKCVALEELFCSNNLIQKVYRERGIDAPIIN